MGKRKAKKLGSKLVEMMDLLTENWLARLMVERKVYKLVRKMECLKEDLKVGKKV